MKLCLAGLAGWGKVVAVWLLLADGHPEQLMGQLSSAVFSHSSGYLLHSTLLAF